MSANMPIPMKHLIVLSLLALVQSMEGLAPNLSEATSTSGGQNNLTTPQTGDQARNGAYNKEISTLFNDLKKLSDNVSKASDQQGNRTQTITRINNTTLDGGPNAEGASNFDVANNSQMGQADDGSLIISVITANILIFVIGFCGNSLVILVILRFTRIETVTDIYILNLAFADLMFLFGLIFLIITMFIDHWVFGTLMCKLYMASTSLNQFASSLLLVVMSFDRFLAVCHPIYAQRFRRLRRAKIICFCIWIMCLILMTPIFAFAKTNKELTCAIFWPEYKSFNCEIAFTLYSFAIGFAIPLLLIAAFYTCVIRKLRIATKGQINLGSTRRLRSRETTNKRIEHLVIGIITTYTICWLPYWMTQLCVSLTTSFERSPIEGFYPFVLIATCLSYTNSALNPILYAFLSDNFKRRCSNVFRSISSVTWCRQGPQSQEKQQTTIETAIGEQSEVNHHHQNNNALNNSIQQRPESRQTMVMEESIKLVSNPSQFVETQQLAPSRPDSLIGGNNHACIAYVANEDLSNQHRDDNVEIKRNQMIGKGMDQCQDDQKGAGIGIRQQPERHHNQQNHNIHNHNQTNGSNDDLKLDDKFYEMDTINNGDVDTHDNQAGGKSLALSVGTIVVQGPNNNGQTITGDHKLLQVTCKKALQQRQEAV